VKKLFLSIWSKCALAGLLQFQGGPVDFLFGDGNFAIKSFEAAARVPIKHVEKNGHIGARLVGLGFVEIRAEALPEERGHFHRKISPVAPVLGTAGDQRAGDCGEQAKASPDQSSHQGGNGWIDLVHLFLWLIPLCAGVSTVFLAAFYFWMERADERRWKREYALRRSLALAGKEEA